jgi:amino acid permease
VRLGGGTKIVLLDIVLTRGFSLKKILVPPKKSEKKSKKSPKSEKIQQFLEEYIEQFSVSMFFFIYKLLVHTTKNKKNPKIFFENLNLQKSEKSEKKQQKNRTFFRQKS